MSTELLLEAYRFRLLPELVPRTVRCRRRTPENNIVLPFHNIPVAGSDCCGFLVLLSFSEGYLIRLTYLLLRHPNLTPLTPHLASLSRAHLFLAQPAALFGLE